MGLKGIEKFDKLIKSLKNKELRIRYFDGETANVTFHLNKPATIEDINLLNHKIGGCLPEEYKLFLSKYNGGEIYNDEGLGGYSFFGTGRLISMNQSISEIYEEDWDRNILIFAECLGEGNYLGFRFLENGKYQILDCFHEEIPVNWNIIGDSFDDFLDKLVECEGNKYWLR